MRNPAQTLTCAGSYLAHPDGHTLKIWLESPEIGFPIKPDNYHCSEPKVSACVRRAAAGCRCCCDACSRFFLRTVGRRARPTPRRCIV